MKQLKFTVTTRELEFAGGSKLNLVAANGDLVPLEYCSSSCRKDVVVALYTTQPVKFNATINGITGTYGKLHVHKWAESHMSVTRGTVHTVTLTLRKQKPLSLWRRLWNKLTGKLTSWL